jgi:hypothetical protein
MWMVDLFPCTTNNKDNIIAFFQVSWGKLDIKPSENIRKKRRKKEQVNLNSDPWIAGSM